MTPCINRGMKYRTAEQVRTLHAAVIANVRAGLPLKSIHDETGVGNQYARSILRVMGYRKMLISPEEFAAVRKSRRNKL